MYINYTPSCEKTCVSTLIAFPVDRLVSNSCFLGKTLKWIKGEEAQGGGGARGSFTFNAEMLKVVLRSVDFDLF